MDGIPGRASWNAAFQGSSLESWTCCLDLVTNCPRGLQVSSRSHKFVVFFVVGLTRYCLVTSILGYMCRSEATSSVRGPWSYIMYRVKPQGNQLTSPPSYNSVRRLQVHWRVPQESHCGRIPRHLRIGICRVESSQLFVLCCGVNGAHTLSYTVTGVTYMHAWRIWSYGTNWTHDK
jgi:hypothetical protein